jgi:hypothetical protein
LCGFLYSFGGKPFQSVENAPNSQHTQSAQANNLKYGASLSTTEVSSSSTEQRKPDYSQTGPCVHDSAVSAHSLKHSACSVSMAAIFSHFYLACEVLAQVHVDVCLTPVSPPPLPTHL